MSSQAIIAPACVNAPAVGKSPSQWFRSALDAHHLAPFGLQLSFPRGSACPRRAADARAADRKVWPIEKRLFALGERYLNAPNRDVRNLAYAFFVHNQHFFTFVHEDGVAPTNNAAERALRTAVAWGSLCILSFEGRKHWGSRIAVSLPRATGRMAASDRQSYRIALKIRTADLPGRIRDHLLGRQHAAVDECADEMMFTIVGVASARFAGVEVANEPPAGWIPVGKYREAAIGVSDQDLLRHWFNLSFRVVARLKPEWTVASAKKDLARVGARLLVEHPERTEEWRTTMGELVPVLFPATQTRVSPGNRPQALGFLALLGGGALLVLTIACLNVANLLLSRTTRRLRELDVRCSLGASRRRLTRQLFTENLVLAAAGAGSGFVIARWMSDLLARFGPTIGTPLGTDTSADLRVLTFVVGIALLIAGGLTVLPMRMLGRASIVSQARVRGASTTPHQLLIAGQIAISLVLFVVAGLFLGTLRNARLMDVTVKSEEVLLADLNLRVAQIDDARGSRLYSQLVERVKALPGVRGAALVFVVPLGGRRGGTQVELGTGPTPDSVSVGFDVVTPGYFATVGIPLLAGRDLNSADRPNTTPVAVINEQMARQLFGDRNPIGMRFRLKWRPASVVEVVGVVRDGRFRTFRSEMEPTVYVPLAQRYMPNMTLEVRGVPSSQLVASIRRQLAALDPDVPLTNIRTAQAHFEAATSRERFLASLLTILALSALLLGAVGVYGTIAFLVAGQTREIGIRLALGAIPRLVLFGVLARVLSLCALGPRDRRAVGLRIHAAASGVSLRYQPY